MRILKDSSLAITFIEEPRCVDLCIRTVPHRHLILPSNLLN